MIKDSSTKFSPSKLDTYQNCPRKYFYQYIEKIPAKTQSVEAHLGSSVHAVLEDLYEGLRNSKTLSLEQVLTVYERVWEQGVNDKEKPIVNRDQRFNLDDWRRVGRECIESYYKANAPFREGKIVGVELRMGFPIKDLNPEQGTEETYRIEGFLDRLMLADDGAFEIHDYKTSKTLPSQADQDADRQLAIYDVAVRAAWPDAKAVRLKWHFLRHGKTIVSTRTDEQRALLSQEILRLIRTIKRDSDFLPVKSALCDWCEYREICPLWKHTEIVAQLPKDAKPFESGVKLADAYAELEAKKKQLKGEIAAIEDEQERLKDQVLEYAKTNEMRALEGTVSRLEISERSSWRFPSKTYSPKDLSVVESALKKTPVWPEVSKLDGPALMEGYEKKSWPAEVTDLIKGWVGKLIIRETSPMLRVMRKKNGEED